MHKRIKDIIKQSKIMRYSLRKYSVGIVSVCVFSGIIIFTSSPVYADSSNLDNEYNSIVNNTEATAILTELEKEENYNIENPSSTVNIESLNSNTNGYSRFFTAENNSNIKAILPLDDSDNIMADLTREDYTKVMVVYNDGTTSKKVATPTLRYMKKSIANPVDLTNAVNELSSVTLEDIYPSLNARVRFLEKREIEENLKKELNRTPTEDEVNQRVASIYIEKLDISKNFENVKNNLNSILSGISERSTGATAEKIIANKINILKGLILLDRQYNFKFGDISAKDLILYHPEFFGSQSNPLDNLISLGNLNYDQLSLQFTDRTFETKLSNLTGSNNIYEFVNNNVQIFDPNKAPKDWFKETSKALIYETETANGDSSLFNKMAHDSRLRKHLIPLLTINENSLYAISTMSTVQYGLVDTYVTDKSNSEQIDALKDKLAHIGKEQQAFLDFWYRISETKDKLFEGNDILVFDTLQKARTGNETARDLWLDAYGANSADGIRQFIAPLGHYFKFFNADGQASGDIVSNFLPRALTNRGQSVYTHELTHILDQKVWFNGHNRRQHQGVEVFARGLFEALNLTDSESGYKPIFNLNTIYDITNPDRTQNASPTRFMSDDDIKEFMQGLMDVLYTLDYAEANAILKHSNSDKAILLNKVELVPDSNPQRPNEVKDKFSNIDEAEASTINNINDFIDKGLVSGRLAFKGNLSVGEARPNDYHVVPLFEPIYAGLQNNAGSVGDITFRRYAYELLAEYGYKNGMVAYLSDQFSNDEEALNNILETKYGGNLAKFKKDMFKRRTDKLDKLKETPYYKTFNELQALMDEAVSQDLSTMKQNKDNNQAITTRVERVHNLKKQVYQYYLRSTADFRSSIYKEELIIGEDREISTESIPVTSIELTDNTMWQGDRREEAGSEGVTTITKTWRTENGVRVGEPTVERVTTKEMIPTKVFVGIKPEASSIIETYTEEIPITTIRVADDSIFEGEEKTDLGNVGTRKVTRTQPTHRDIPQGNPTYEYEIITPMKPTTIRYGTKKKTSPVILGEDREVSTESIPVTSIELTDNTMWQGDRREEAGSEGVTTITKTWRTENGARVGEPTVERVITKEMIPTKIFVGIKPNNGSTTETYEEEIPTSIQEAFDENLYVGESHTKAGQSGKRRVTKTQATYKGLPTGEANYSYEILEEMVPTIIYKGSKKKSEIVESEDKNTDDTPINNNTVEDTKSPSSVNDILPSIDNLNINNTKGVLSKVKSPNTRDLNNSVLDILFGGFVGSGLLASLISKKRRDK